MFIACKMESLTGIFGAPQEPFFNHRDSGICPEVLQEWLLDLSIKNSQYLNIKSKYKDSFKSSHHIDLIYKACEKMKMSSQVKLLAVEIFNRFMTKHVEELYTHVVASGSRTKRSDWLKIVERISKQQALRIMSCCQIASKLTSHYKMITASKSRRFLRELGHHYTSDSILQSELRILKTLDYKLTVASPLHYVDTLLEVIGYNDRDIDVKLYHSTAIKLLLLFNLKRLEVKKKLLQYARISDAAVHEPHSERVNQMMSNMMMLGAAAITAAVFIMDRTATDKIVDHLSLVTKIPSDSIIDFATVIIEVVQEGNVQTWTRT